jgi:hypothetical protein
MLPDSTSSLSLQTPLPVDAVALPTFARRFQYFESPAVAGNTPRISGYGHTTSGFQCANIPAGLCLQTHAWRV